MLDLRPATRERFWRAWVRLPVALAGGPLLPGFQKAPAGSVKALVRDSARVVKGGLRVALGTRLSAFLGQVFSLRKRVEMAFLASGVSGRTAVAFERYQTSLVEASQKP